MPMNFLMFVIMSLLLAGCTNLPPVISSAPSDDVPFAEARQNVAAYRGRAVRWGGSIISVETAKDASWVQVLEYPVTRYGRPSMKRLSSGRFVIRTAEFLDPAIYEEGQEITVFGRLNGEVERSVGERSITMPVVDAEQLHLWEDYRDRDQRYYPYSGYDYYPYPYRSRFGYGYYWW